MSNLPIEFEDKENSPELLAFLEQYGPTKYLSAEEINKIRDCINELNNRNPNKGYWNAETNTPSLENGVGRPGDYFEVSVPGERFSYTFAAGDRIEYTTVGIWVKTVDNNQTPDLSDYYNKSEVEALVVGLWDDRGAYTVNASGNINYPSSGGSGASGALLKGDIFTVAGAVVGTSTVNTIAVNNGDTIRALIDSPSATNDSHWTIAENNIGYVPENSVNKSTTITGNETSNILFPTIKAFFDYLVGMTWLTDQIWGTWINGLTSKTTPVDADYSIEMDSADGNKAKKVSWANRKATLRVYFDTLYASKFRIGSATNSSTVTGTTSLTLVSGPTLIPANTFVTGDAFTFRVRLKRTVPTSSNSVAYFYVSASASVTNISDASLTQIASYAVSLTNTLVQGKSEVVIKNAANATELVQYTNSDDDIMGSDYRLRTDVDWTVNKYVYLFIWNAQTTTSSFISFWELFKK